MTDQNLSSNAVDRMFNILKEAAVPGGPSALSVRTELMPAGGFDRLVAPPRYASNGGATYVFEKRYISKKDSEEPAPHITVLLDSRESNANRLEEAIAVLAEDDHNVFSKMPKIRVTYSDEKNGTTFTLCDYQLPHRAFDAHIRLAEFHGEQENLYENACKSTPKNASNLLDVSPVTILLGGWDSHGGQSKFPALIVGETYGVLPDDYANPQEAEHDIRRRSGARLDPVSAGFDTKVLNSIKLDDNKTLKGKASEIGLGHIPPALETVDGISVSRIVRHNILQFGALRRLHFGKGADKDKAIRVLLAAMAIDAMVHANDDLFLRANCQLVLSNESCWNIDSTKECTMLSPENADILLNSAFEEATKLEAINWSELKTLELTGNSDLLAAANNQEQG